MPDNPLALEKREPKTEALTAVSSAGAESRETAALQAAYVMADRNRRDEVRAFDKIFRSCERATFARKAVYSFPRGREMVTGLSVHFAREAGRCWGNLRFGFEVVESGRFEAKLRAMALDLETNAADIAETVVRFVQIRRDKKTGQPFQVEIEDERDRLELVNRIGAKLVRNCILHILPEDCIERALEVCKNTAALDAKGELKESREQTITKLVAHARANDVTVDDLERRIGHPMADITADDLTELRANFQAMKEGVAKRDDIFPRPKAEKVEEAAKAVKGGSGAQADLDALAGKSEDPGGEVSAEGGEGKPGKKYRRRDGGRK